MKITHYLKDNPTLTSAEDATEELLLAVAEDHGLQLTLRQEPREEPNCVRLSVLFAPHLLEPFEHIAWRRTFRWLARHHGLPANLVGTDFLQDGQPRRFAGASMRCPSPGLYYIALYPASGALFHLSLEFVRLHVVPRLPLAPSTVGMLSIGLGADEVFFKS